MRHLIPVFLGVASGFFANAASLAGPQVWPEVAPLQETFQFPDARTAKADVTITRRDGQWLYRLICRTPHSVDTPEPSRDWSGDFECILVSQYSKDPWLNLLTDDPNPTRDWNHRGRFLVDELDGKCGKYPEHGLIRHFRLRGMHLTMTVANPTFDTTSDRRRLKSFDFRVGVEPDPGALSAIAEPVPFDYPRFGKCESPRSQHVPGIISEDYVRSEGLGPPWPRVRPVRKTGVIPPNFSLPIPDSQGGAAYELACDEDRLAWEYGIVCRLVAAGRAVNLLEDSVDLYSRQNRAEFRPRQIYGTCSKEPEWGARRTFRLRGLKLTLEFKNPVFADLHGHVLDLGAWEPDFFMTRFKRIEVHVNADTDPTARSPVAEPSRFAKWSVCR